MAENKKSFIAYSDWVNIFDQLTDEEAGKLVKHLFSYVNDRSPSLSDRMLKIVFEPIRLQLKRDLTVWQIELDKKSDGGKLGNLKRYYPDLYTQVVGNQLSIEDAMKKVKERKELSHTDTKRNSPSDSIASVAVTVTDTVTVNDTVNNTLHNKLNLLQKFEKNENEFKNWGNNPSGQNILIDRLKKAEGI
jgi:hypothetical protein